MTSPVSISTVGLDFIKAHEGFRARAAQLADGRWVVGHSHIESAVEGREVTSEEAERLLRDDLAPIEKEIADTAYAPVSQGQFDALVSLAFNIGLRNFRRSGVMKHVNEHRPLDAAAAFDIWRRGRVNGRVMVLDALMRRRAAERALFLSAGEDPIAAPTAEITPVADPDAVAGAPVDSPVRLAIDFDADRSEITAQAPRGRRTTEAAASDAIARIQSITPVRADHARAAIAPPKAIDAPALSPAPAAPDTPAERPEPVPAPEPVAEPQLAPPGPAASVAEAVERVRRIVPEAAASEERMADAMDLADVASLENELFADTTDEREAVDGAEDVAQWAITISGRETPAAAFVSEIVAAPTPHAPVETTPANGARDQARDADEEAPAYVPGRHAPQEPAAERPWWELQEPEAAAEPTKPVKDSSQDAVAALVARAAAIRGGKKLDEVDEELLRQIVEAGPRRAARRSGGGGGAFVLGLIGAALILGGAFEMSQFASAAPHPAEQAVWGAFVVGGATAMVSAGFLVARRWFARPRA